LLIELTSLDLHAVGITIFQSDGLLVNELDAEIISNVKSTAIFSVELNTLRLEVQGGEKYTIIVSTFKPQEVRSSPLSLFF